MVLKMDLAISRIAVLLTENTKNILENDKIIILTFVCDKTYKIKNTNLRQNMDRKQIENSINQKKAEAIKEAKKEIHTNRTGHDLGREFPDESCEDVIKREMDF